MARVRQRPEQRFTDIIPLWETALMERSARYIANSYSDAVHKVHRLNQYRKELRGVDEICPLDQFVVRQVGDEVHILERPTVDLSRLSSLSGKPYREIFKEEEFTQGPPTDQAKLDRLKADLKRMNPGVVMPWEQEESKPKSLGLNTESDITEGIEQIKIDPSASPKKDE